MGDPHGRLSKMRTSTSIAMGLTVAVLLPGIASAHGESIGAVSGRSLGAATAMPTATSDNPATGRAVIDPNVSNRTLAADVLFGCTDMGNTATQRRMAEEGMAGIVLLGNDAPRGLRRQLARVQRAAPSGHEPLIASDEEGGAVQRLDSLIRPLPDAETMGTWSAGKLRRVAASYGRGMARLGVLMSLAPVADLRVPGTYIDDLGRAFASSPRTVGRSVVAWSSGLQDAGVAPVVKHWPGHGHARDTHQFAARVPSRARLERADMIPFRQSFAAGVPAVMVAHVQSRGLTPNGVPATQSRKAISVLRSQAGPDTVIITDSLSMAAASSARGLSEAEATIASLRAGVDWAMTCSTDPIGIVKAVTRAIDRGKLDRDQLLQSAARIRALKDSLG